MKKVIFGIAGIAIIGIGLWLILGGKVEKNKPVQQEAVRGEISEDVTKPQTPLTAEQAQQAELKLVETIKLPEGVKDVILDEERGKPAIYLKEEAIQFLDDKMKVRKEYKLPCPLTPNEQECWTRVEFSKGNKFIGVNTIRKYEKETVEEAEFVMLDKDGNEVWRRKHNYYSIIPSPNGEYFLGFEDPSCGGCPIKIEHSSGQLNKPLIWSEYRNDITDKGMECISDDGSFFVISTLGPYDVEKNKIGPETVSILDKNGIVLWSSVWELFGPCLFVGKDLLILSNQDANQKISKVNITKGGVIWEREVKSGGYALFYSDTLKNILLIGQSGSGNPIKIYMLDFVSGEIKKETEISLLLSEHRKKVSAVSIDHKYLIISSYISLPRTEPSNDYILLVDISTLNIIRKKYKFGSILRAVFMDEGEIFTIYTKEGIEEYRNPFYKK